MNRIKKLRIEKGISQVELGNLFNISQQTISSYEKGTREPDSELLKLFSNYFEVSIDYILGNSDIKESAKDILNKSEPTIALNSEHSYDDLPKEAREKVYEYIEMLRLKYKNK